MKSSDIRTILVYTGMELLGDGVMKIPFIRAIRQAFPRAHITWMTGHGPTSLASSLHSLVKDDLAEIIETTHLGYDWRQFFDLPRPWKKRYFDLILDTQSKNWRSLILRKIPHKYFVSRSWGWMLSDFKPPHNYIRPPHLVDRLIDMVAFAAGERPHPSYDVVVPESYHIEAEKLLPGEKKYLGLSPGAGQEKKCWPLEYYIELGQFFTYHGYHPVFILGPKEEAWRTEISKKLPIAQFPLQRTSEKSPLLTMALAHRFTAIVANDSGVGHLLATGHKPMVSLFGPTSAERYKPFNPHGITITSQEFGSGRDINTIPVSVVAGKISNMV